MLELYKNSMWMLQNLGSSKQENIAVILKTQGE